MSDENEKFVKVRVVVNGSADKSYMFVIEPTSQYLRAI